MFVLSYFLIFVKIIAQKKRFVSQTDKSLFSAWIYIKTAKTLSLSRFLSLCSKISQIPKIYL